VLTPLVAPVLVPRGTTLLILVAFPHAFVVFGKSPLNVFFIALRVVLCARCKGDRFAIHINTTFFGTALAPVFSELLFSTSLPLAERLPLSVATTLLLGFVLAPVAAQLFKARMGYSLYNMRQGAHNVQALIAPDCWQGQTVRLDTRDPLERRLALQRRRAWQRT